MNNNDYLNDKISFEWLKHFDKYIRIKQKEIWYIFIINRAKSYIYSKFVQVCYNKNILPFYLLIYITHLL